MLARDLLDQEILGHAELELLALVAAELQRHVPDRPQTVLLHVHHGGALGGQAAIDLAFRHLGPPLQGQLAAAAQDRVDRLAVLAGVITAAIGDLAEADFRLPGRAP